MQLYSDVSAWKDEGKNAWFTWQVRDLLFILAFTHQEESVKRFCPGEEEGTRKEWFNIFDFPVNKS